MFSSMPVIWLSTVIVMLLITGISTKSNPIYAAIHFLHTVIRNRLIIIHFICLFFILFLNKFELQIEETFHLNQDMSYLFYQIEGDIVYTIQNFFQNSNLTYFFTFFYVIVFPSLLISSFVVYAKDRDYVPFYTVFYAIMINYIVAIPFYLFFPINEVWFAQDNVNFLIPDVYPTFEDTYRNLSGLNNCFPSLHTSISMTLALIALKSKNKIFKGIVVTSALIIMFSTLYLGIHWIIDMMGGIILSIIAVTVGWKISNRLQAVQKKKEEDKNDKKQEEPKRLIG